MWLIFVKVVLLLVTATLLLNLKVKSIYIHPQLRGINLFLVSRAVNNASRLQSTSVIVLSIASFDVILPPDWQIERGRDDVKLVLPSYLLGSRALYAVFVTTSKPSRSYSTMEVDTI